MGTPINDSKSFINPAGMIELRSTGPSTRTAVYKNIRALTKLAKSLQAESKPVLILIDVEEISSSSLASREATLDAMLRVPHDKAAFYGPLKWQIILNTLSMVANKRETIRAFITRQEAVEWLKSKDLG